MEVTNEPYGDDLELPTATCKQCGESQPLMNIEDPEICQRIRNRRIREMADTVLAGLKAFGQLFRLSANIEATVKQLVGQEVPPIISHPQNKPLPPMNEGDIELLMSFLTRQRELRV
ncbi:MAG: hypothetical protein A3J62_01605 [Candidatus Buchananbacteria bacterium RIFCSPHIGHO2_02_FULL_38_8]|nr:MAG: hypothetical protein A3J62_01605 [Candidatus Buchananbacteria bacterium RIFCSPHIGHO2_02_FULL_38_8]